MSSSETGNDPFAFDMSKGKELVLSNMELFESKINEAKRQMKEKNYEMASRWGLEAGKFAVFNHPGCFNSPQLEELLLECGRHLPGVRLALKIPESDGRRRVFHIISEGYSVGGHTRLVKNWIERDKDSIHYLINTWQIKTTPKWLIETVGNNGGICIPLDTVSGSFLARAAALREIVHRYADVVVCHIHMDDPIPVMAMGTEGGPPVIFLNHADHLFWMGSSIADVVCDLRPAAQKLTLSRRNIKTSCLLPIPLNIPQWVPDKDIARKELGLPKDADIILSIASGKKFDSFGKYDFIDFLNSIVRNHANTKAVVVGPANTGKWLDASEESNKRIMAVGVQNEIENYYSSADIYLDSYIVGSLASALDAGLRGIPLAGLKNNYCEVLSCADISFEGKNNRFTSINEYMEYIDRLLKDKDFAASEGKSLSDSIREHHVDLWKDYLENAYELAEKTKHSINLQESKDEWDIGDLFLATFLKKS